MAFVFLAEDGYGVPDANAYAEVTYVDEYHQGRGNAAWAALTAQAKREAIVRATDYLERRYGHRWIGRKGSAEQGLHFPARDAYLVEHGGEPRPVTGVPESLRKAVAELALRAARGPLEQDQPGGAVASESRSGGGLARSVTYARPGAPPVYSAAERWITALLRQPMAVRA